MFKGRAEVSSARAFLQSKNLHPDQIRQMCGIPVSSLAIGTYLGPMDEITDARVTKAVLKSLELGCNFIDSAINYRGQRAERSIGEALRQAFLSKKLNVKKYLLVLSAALFLLKKIRLKILKNYFKKNMSIKEFVRNQI